MSTWILLIYIYAGMLAHGDSVSMFAVPGFNSKTSCVEAGTKSEPLVDGSFKKLRYVCLEQAK